MQRMIRGSRILYAKNNDNWSAWYCMPSIHQQTSNHHPNAVSGCGFVVVVAAYVVTCCTAAVFLMQRTKNHVFFFVRRERARTVRCICYFSLVLLMRRSVKCIDLYCACARCVMRVFFVYMVMCLCLCAQRGNNKTPTTQRINGASSLEFPLR